MQDKALSQFRLVFSSSVTNRRFDNASIRKAKLKRFGRSILTFRCLCHRRIIWHFADSAPLIVLALFPLEISEFVFFNLQKSQFL
eukprot:scaffold2992_cov214-Amphora_coffeaeformis.AAC.11